MERNCPCCGGLVFSTTNNENLRKGIKFGTKTAIKYGAKELLGGGATSTGAAIGASIGSIVPVVGTFVGGVIGGAVAHVAADAVLDVAYDEAEKRIAPQNHYFHCYKCDITWNSFETDDREILINNYENRYLCRSRNLPEPPTKDANTQDLWEGISLNLLLWTLIPIGGLFALHICSWTAYLCTFTLWDPRDTTWGYITTTFWWALAISGIVLFICLIYHCVKKIQAVMRYKSAYAKYEKELIEVSEYNAAVEKQLREELNGILRKKGLKEHFTHL